MTFASGTYASSTYAGAVESRTVVATGSGTLVTVEQKVTIVGSGTLLTLNQETEHYFTGSGTLVTIEQEVKTTASGTLVSIAQVVVDQAFTSCRNYQASILIGGVDVTSQATNDLTVSFEEDTAALCSFQLRPGKGVQNISSYFGRTVIVNAAGADGTFKRIFTGVVDTIEFDTIESVTSIRATNRRKELLNAVTNPRAQFGTGYDTTYLINEDLSTEELIGRLLDFQDKSLDFDPYNNILYTSWTPKTTADFTFTNPDVLRKDPDIQLVDRGRVINKVNVTFNHEFSTLHYMSLLFQWQAPYSNSATDTGWGSTILKGGYTLTRRDTIEAAISGTGWKLKGSINYEGLPPAGWYDDILWLGDKKDPTTQAVRDSNNNILTDSAGNYIYSTSSRKNLDAGGFHCSYAGFTLTERWSQQSIKKYQLTIESSTSQSLFGTVESDISITVPNEYDTQRWDNYEAYTPTFDVGDGTTIDLQGASSTTNVIQKEGTVNANIQAAIDEAKIKILKSHRDNTVNLPVKLKPDINLSHTVEFSTDRIDVKGKVKSYTHTIPMSGGRGLAQTDIEIAFYFLGTGGSDTARSLPSISLPSVTYPTAKQLGAYYGKDPESLTYIRKAGFFGNKVISLSQGQTTYVVQFRIDVPALPANLTGGKEYPGSKTFNISIPASTLTEIKYVEGCK